jgi:hypothetical protein
MYTNTPQRGLGSYAVRLLRREAARWWRVPLVVGII